MSDYYYITGMETYCGPDTDPIYSVSVLRHRENKPPKIIINQAVTDNSGLYRGEHMTIMVYNKDGESVELQLSGMPIITTEIAEALSPLVEDCINAVDKTTATKRIKDIDKAIKNTVLHHGNIRGRTAEGFRRRLQRTAAILKKTWEDEPISNAVGFRRKAAATMVDAHAVEADFRAGKIDAARREELMPTEKDKQGREILPFGLETSGEILAAAVSVSDLAQRADLAARSGQQLDGVEIVGGMSGGLKISARQFLIELGYVTADTSKRAYDRIRLDMRRRLEAATDVRVRIEADVQGAEWTTTGQLFGLTVAKQRGGHGEEIWHFWGINPNLLSIPWGQKKGGLRNPNNQWVQVPPLLHQHINATDLNTATKGTADRIAICIAVDMATTGERLKSLEAYGYEWANRRKFDQRGKVLNAVRDGLKQVGIMVSEPDKNGYVLLENPKVKQELKDRNRKKQIHQSRMVREGQCRQGLVNQ